MDSLKVTHIAKSYKGRQVVRDVSLSLESGQIVGLLGPNGAGKTTCFYMIVGLIKAEGGSIELNGSDITSLPSTPAPSAGSDTCHRTLRYSGR